MQQTTKGSSINRILALVAICKLGQISDLSERSFILKGYFVNGPVVPEYPFG